MIFSVRRGDLPLAEAEFGNALELSTLDRGRQRANQVILRKGQFGMTISMALVTIRVLLAEAVGRLGAHRFSAVIGRSLIIIARVVPRSPAESLLFEHLPIRRRRRLCRALGEAGVTSVSATAEAEAT